MAIEPLLALDKLAVAYGGIQAVKGIDLHVDPAELVCLIGANGAGKTTTLKGICGLQPVRSGQVRYAGEDVTGRPAFELVRKGLAMGITTVCVGARSRSIAMRRKIFEGPGPTWSMAATREAS